MAVDLLIGGLDLATSGTTGYAAPNGTLHGVKPDRIVAHPTPWDLACRTGQVRNLLLRCIRMNPPLPTFMVIEGPFFQFKEASARLDEQRGVIRLALVEAGIRFVEVNPDYLQLFATGKGKHPKGEGKGIMLHCATSRMRQVFPGRREPRDHNEADAWHLREMGLVACGLLKPWTEFQFDAIERCKVQWPALVDR